MYRLTNLTDNAKQSIVWRTPNGEEVTLYFEYIENNLGWYFGIQYGANVNYKNLRLTTNYNILRAYKNYLPFGMRIETLDGLEPMSIDDFSSGYANIYMLTSEECEQTEGVYYGKI